MNCVVECGSQWFYYHNTIIIIIIIMNIIIIIIIIIIPKQSQIVLWNVDFSDSIITNIIMAFIIIATMMLFTRSPWPGATIPGTCDWLSQQWASGHSYIVGLHAYISLARHCGPLEWHNSPSSQIILRQRKHCRSMGQEGSWSVINNLWTTSGCF